MKHHNEDNISQVMNDSVKMQSILKTAINDALSKHKHAGNSVCGYKNGEVFWVSAEKILISK
jgi:predicted class III extradiol MEMO1 family dioxygenase